MNKELVKFKKQIREAVANYMKSEGCSCCQGDDHYEHEVAIAKLLGIKKYADESGYDFSKHETKKS